MFWRLCWLLTSIHLWSILWTEVVRIQKCHKSHISYCMVDTILNLKMVKMKLWGIDVQALQWYVLNKGTRLHFLNLCFPSVLGPILPLGLVFKKHGLSYHLYADDIQIYLPIRPGGPPSHSSLFCRSWGGEVLVRAKSTKKQLNATKSEVAILCQIWLTLT